MLWKLEQTFGPVVPEVIDQVAVAHALVALGPEPKAQDVRSAFAKAGVQRPSAKYAEEMSAMLGRCIKRQDLLDLILEFRQYAMGALSRRFGGKTSGREGELRDYLRTYLTPRGYAEAEAGRGNTDILIPSIPAIIETKVWESLDVYESGLEQLRRYIHTERPKAAYMVMFADRYPPPSIAIDHERAIADEPVLSGLKVPVVVVPFEVDSPSKARATGKRRARLGR